MRIIQHPRRERSGIMEYINMEVNGQSYTIGTEKHWTLLYVIREVLDLTGAKCGCNTGDCGACTVIMNGKAVRSCMVNAKKADQAIITTIEGLAKGEELHPIQQAFIDAGAVQCGFCTPGMILSAKALLDQNPLPSEEEVRHSLDHNLCRCTGYDKIVQAVLLAAKRMGGDTEWKKNSPS